MFICKHVTRLKRAEFARFQIEVFKSSIDRRYDDELVVSHDKNTIPSKAVNHSSDIIHHDLKAEVIGIDEAQFFDKDLIKVCNRLANNGIRVIVAGLDMDYTGRPFGPIPGLMAIAEHCH